MRSAMLVIVAVTLIACHPVRIDPPLADRRIVDLSHAFDEHTIYWPTEEGFAHLEGTAGVTEKGYYYEAHSYRVPEHGGTHIDAPAHFWKGGRSVDQIPVERLIGPGIVVDVSAACATFRDHQVTVAELQSWEARHGQIPVGAIVLLRTGFGRHWPDRFKYLGTAERGPGAVAKLHFPGLHPEAATWLTKARRIGAIGLDTASIDYGQSTLFESHVALFSAGVPALENVADLEGLPETGFVVLALPMKIRRGSGAPTRVIAILPEPR
jgi:kynurenine formamidase